MSLKLLGTTGASRTLLGHYKLIGAELVKYESNVCSLRSIGRRVANSNPSSDTDSEEGTGLFLAPLKEFKEGVSFIPIEVLESYLEDLLDLNVTESRLYIWRPLSYLPAMLFSLFGLLIALAIGLYAARSGATMPISFAVTVLIALPFALLWHYGPGDTMVRRVSFAKVLSQEIARRRGSDDTYTTSRIVDAELMRKLLGRAVASSAAKPAKVYH